MQEKKYLMGIMTCKALLHKADEQYEKYLQNIVNYPIIYLKFIGDPNIETEYIYDKEQNLLTLKCEDDYLNLPHKVYCFLQAITQIFPNVTNVIKIDDDITIDLHRLYELIVKYEHMSYVGKYFKCDECISYYLSNKNEVYSLNPDFMQIPVYLEANSYCSGGTYFLNKESINIILDHPEFFPIIKGENTYKHLILKLPHNKQYFVNLFVFEDYNVGFILGKHNVLGLNIENELAEAVKW